MSTGPQGFPDFGRMVGGPSTMVIKDANVPLNAEHDYGAIYVGAYTSLAVLTARQAGSHDVQVNATFYNDQGLTVSTYTRHLISAGGDEVFGVIPVLGPWVQFAVVSDSYGAGLQYFLLVLGLLYLPRSADLLAVTCEAQNSGQAIASGASVTQQFTASCDGGIILGCTPNAFVGGYGITLQRYTGAGAWETVGGVCTQGTNAQRAVAGEVAGDTVSLRVVVFNDSGSSHNFDWGATYL